MPVTLAALGPRMFELRRRAGRRRHVVDLPAGLPRRRRPTGHGAGRRRGRGRPAPPIVTQVSAVVATDRGRGREAGAPDAGGLRPQPPVRPDVRRRRACPSPTTARPATRWSTRVTAHGDEAGLTDRLGALAEAHDELLVTLESAGDRRADEDALLRALGNVTRTAAAGPAVTRA